MPWPSMRTGVVGTQTGYRRAFCVTGLERPSFRPIGCGSAGKIILFYTLALHYLCFAKVGCGSA